ncbi:MAG TPA: hypothetical protein VGE01_10950 [Fimbriimonas sp.]
MKKEINPGVFAAVIALIVLVVGAFIYQRVSARPVDSWDTMSEDTKAKIGAAYGARPGAQPPK